MRFRALAMLVAAPLGAQTVDNAFFEKEIRPVLVNKCFGCHSAKLKTPMGGLLLDTRAGMRAGGDGGAILVPGSPDASRLIEALEYQDSELRMPPTGKLPAREIEAFRQWIAGGAPDPRVDTAAPASQKREARSARDDGFGYRLCWAFGHTTPWSFLVTAARPLYRNF